MLSGETSKGLYPLEIVQTMSCICLQAEAAMLHGQPFEDLEEALLGPLSMAHTTAVLAVEAANRCNAFAIIAIATSDLSCHLISRPDPGSHTLRSHSSPGKSVPDVHSMNYENPCTQEWNEDEDRLIRFAIEYGMKNFYFKPGSFVILVAGWKAGSGSTYMLRVPPLVDAKSRPILATTSSH